MVLARQQGVSGQYYASVLVIQVLDIAGQDPVSFLKVLNELWERGPSLVVQVLDEK